ncbi:hypothetical protein A2108_01155 [Candidatus Wolfebacteria bacterium GWA1_42_9]|uniref:Uncharacterized protein n=1 Tax=Candidatus Wolfebacteria bacterium GWA1_42_9 TaxID=1802553 RepID=A0A1F8DMC2_9BACT|nr:MAG: hypothetical protein UW08_C0003G0033 [Parcubacteria group bacterium GW2011_GWB1_43_8b]OGM89586.1 MAG: hypothetical protein A2108_01155 [Candidatus Wolfebacteria bacterium GWA1_42_9]
MSNDWELKNLPSFDSDLEKYQIVGENFDKWLGDFKKAPHKLKNAHALRGVLKYHWTAHFNSEVLTYTVIYFICWGKEENCFKKKVKVNSGNVNSLRHSCEANKGKVFLMRIIPHKDNYKF